MFSPDGRKGWSIGRVLLLGLLVVCACGAGQNGDGDFRRAREAMVRTQIEARGVDDTDVLAAMRAVPRHEFVPVELRDEAYADCPLRIGHGQTISQPYIVAWMSAALDVEPGQRVLEIGTGSGYQAAVLAEMGVEVYSIEIISALGRRARDVLARLGYDLHLRIGDGYDGWPEEAPFDAVILTAAPRSIPEPLERQLAEGGMLVAPVGTGFRQMLRVLRKVDGELCRVASLPVRFVPMTGRAEQ